MTILNYRQHLRLHILPFLGETKLSALTPTAVHAFTDRLHKEGRSADMIGGRGSLGSIFKEARRRGLVATAPTAGVNKKKKADRDNPRPPIPSKAELRAIIAEATKRGPRWHAFILVAIFCGLRASELRGLNWADVDFTERVIHVTAARRRPQSDRPSQIEVRLSLDSDVADGRQCVAGVEAAVPEQCAWASVP